MSWMIMATAPKDVSLLGYDAAKKRPFVMIWNVAESRFIEACGGDDDLEPTLWGPLPSLPSVARAECLKHPFVMSWSSSKQDFVVQNGLGDETPSLCMLIPPVMELELA